jgi:hypothetical protein
MSLKNLTRQKIISPVSLTLILLTIILLVSDYNLRWKNEQWKYAVHTDAADYYRYLPMVFIDHKFDDQADNPSVIKYFVGTAVLYSPFFTIACAGSYFSGFPVDGYSIWFPILISIGTLFYFIFGLYYFSKFLKYYITPPWIIPVVLFTITFGTVAFHYTVNTPGWSHIPAFWLVCYLFYHFKKLMTDYNQLSIIAIIAGTSFLFFTRPTDVIVIVLAPFFADGLNSFFTIIKRVSAGKRTILIGICLALIPLLCQISIYKVYTGKFFIWSYTKEGFDFLHPEITNVLFSYAKGFFVYTPICFLSLFGFFRLYKINLHLFYGILIYLVSTIYLVSSWWCWNYGYSYGARVFIEHYPIFFFLLALLLDVKNWFLKVFTIIFIVLLSALNLFQIYQAENGILDQDFKTNEKGYWDVFLSTEKGYSGKYYRYPVDERPENILKRISFFNDMEKKDTFWLNPGSQVTDISHSGDYSSKVNKDSWYSTGIREKLNNIPYSKNVLIRVSGWFFIPEKGSDSYFAISFVANCKSRGFYHFSLDGSTENFNKWEFHTFEMYMPKLSKEVEEDPETLVEFYYFNNSKMNCYIDDLNIEFLEFKKMDRVLDLSWE